MTTRRVHRAVTQIHVDGSPILVQNVTSVIANAHKTVPRRIVVFLRVRLNTLFHGGCEHALHELVVVRALSALQVRVVRFLPPVSPAGLHVLDSVGALRLVRVVRDSDAVLFCRLEQAIVARAPVGESFFLPGTVNRPSGFLVTVHALLLSLTCRLGRAGSNIRVQALFHGAVSFRHHTQCDVVFRHGGKVADSHKVIRCFRRVRPTAVDRLDQHLLTARTDLLGRQLAPTVQGSAVADTIPGVQV